MKYMKVTVKTTTDAVDFISNLFDEIGLEGIQIEDHVPLSEEDKRAMYIDILPELPEDDGIAVVSSYFEPGSFDLKQLEKQIREGLEEISLFVNIGDGCIEIVETDDKDWINNWKEFFKPFRVADDIVIKPTWETLEECQPNDLIIEIDPGTAFGTGSHETTKLCILGLKKYINSDTKLLDVGCGSGILSIIGLKLGAQYAFGTDIDQNALIVTQENIQVNNILPEQFDLLAGDIISDTLVQDKAGYHKYDIVVANILADVIIPLSGEIHKHLKEDGVFISSGIINTKRKEVEEALLKNNFRIIEVNEMGDWVSFVAKIAK